MSTHPVVAGATPEAGTTEGASKTTDPLAQQLQIYLQSAGSSKPGQPEQEQRRRTDDDGEESGSTTSTGSTSSDETSSTSSPDVGSDSSLERELEGGDEKTTTATTRASAADASSMDYEGLVSQYMKEKAAAAFPAEPPASSKAVKSTPPPKRQGGLGSGTPPSETKHTEGRHSPPPDYFLLEKAQHGLVADCPACDHIFRLPPEPVSVSMLFAVPTKPELLLSVIGASDPLVGTPRPCDELVKILTTLEHLLRIASRADDEVYVDLLDTETDVPLVADIQRYSATVTGWVDFLVTCGFERTGGALSFYRDPAHRPCQRVVIGVQLLKDELEALRVSEGRRRIFTQPVMDQIGHYLTLYTEAQQRNDDSHYFPTFDQDLLEWIKLRNFFYSCVLCSSASGSEEQVETWVGYYQSSQEMAQETLSRVESRHEALKVRHADFHQLVRESKSVQDLMKPVRGELFQTTPSKEATTKAAAGLSTPPTLRQFSPSSESSPPFASPGELLLRTPIGGVDRECYKACAPPPHMWIRDSRNQPIGLLNMRQCCYVNALVQLLFSVPTFVKGILTLKLPTASWEEKGSASSVGSIGATSASSALVTRLPPNMLKIVERLQVLFAYIHLSQCRCINPIPLLESVAAAFPHFADGGQHDPHEFADCLLSAVTDIAKELFPRVHPPTEKETATDPMLRLWEGLMREEAVEKKHKTLTALSLHAKPIPDEYFVQSNLHENLIASSLIPLYFDPKNFPSPGIEDDDEEATKERKEGEEGEAATAVPPVQQHVDPCAEKMSFDEEEKKTEGEAKLHRHHHNHHHHHHHPRREPSLQESFEDFMIECRGSTGGVLRSFRAVPHSLVFYLPSRTSSTGLECHGLPFNFPNHLTLKPFLASNYSNPQHGDGAGTVNAFDAKEILYHKICREELSADFQRCCTTVDTLEKALEGDSPHSLHSEVIGLIHSARTKAQDLEEAVHKHEKIIHKAAAALNPPKEAEGYNKEDPWLYELSAVVVHHGERTDCGHYYSYIRRPVEEDQEENREDSQQPQQSTGLQYQWFRCDDTSVEAVDPDVLESFEVRQGVYCLLYNNHIASGGGGQVSTTDLDRCVPDRLKQLVEKEDMRKQLRMAQQLSFNV